MREMLTIRRALATFLGLVFVFLLLIARFAFRANATLLEADFYIDQAREADLYGFLSNELIPAGVDERLQEEGDLPFGLTITGKEIGEDFKRVAPASWVRDQVETIIDEVGPYLTGSQESFQVTVALAERADAAVEVVQGIFIEANVRDFLFDEVITPAVEGNIGESVGLPFGVTFTDDEVISALNVTLTPEWIKEQQTRIADEVAPYLAGQTNSFRIAVPLAEPIDAALAVLLQKAEDQLDRELAGLPLCTLDQVLQQADRVLSNQLPNCRVFGVNLDLLKGAFDITGSVRQLITDQIQEELIYTHQDLRSTLSTEQVELLDRVREVVNQGWTYTHTDLRQDLTEGGDAQTVDLLDDVREVLSQGWTYTEADLRQDLNEDSNDALEDFRINTDRIRGYRFIVYPVLGLFLVGIGFLGGRRWNSRIAWGAGVLALAALVAYVIFGPVYSGVFESRVQDTLDEVTEDREGVSLLIAEKAITIVENVVGDFASGAANLALPILIIAVIVFGVSLA